MAGDHDAHRRSDVSAESVGDESELQEGGGRIEVGSGAVLGTMNRMPRLTGLLAVLALLFGPARPALAQIDLTGTWANRLHEDWVERAPGPHIGDYTGLPINDDARAVADAY